MGANSVEVGCRIHCEGELATVLYIGEIESLEGIWLGIEWDNPSRGKHNGCYNGVSYFTTRVPSAGSFIKSSKADFGITCPDAVKVKYGKDVESNCPPSFINLPQKSGLKRHIEMVGMEKIMRKQNNFANLSEVVLSSMFISGAGAVNEVRELIPNVRDLDLSQNLITSWSTVNDIAKQLPFLSTLILSKNRLKIIQEEPSDEVYQSLKMLVLNDMAYDWKEILSCARMWPHIEDLCVLDNGISVLSPPPPSVFSRLKLLSLDNNPIRCWKQVIHLGNLISLEELHVENISLESIEFPETSALQKTDLFSNLKVLYLKNNLLQKWRDISELSKLRSLTNLRITHNPVLHSVNLDTARQLIIAKLTSLEVLNRTQVDRSERRGAELDYLKRYRSEWISGGGSTNPSQSRPSEDFSNEHPTYEALLQKHGAADEAEVAPQNTLIKDNLIYVRIFSPMMPEKPILTKKLPADMTVGKLKVLVQRIFKVAAHEITLTHVFKEDEKQRTEMDNNLRQLSFYSISNEDKISVEW